MALLSGSKRSATVFAMNDVGLVRFTQEQFFHLMETDQSALGEMSATAIPRWQRQQISNALRTLLGEVDAAALDALQEQLVWSYYANGEVIFRQGDPSDGMYIVVNGRLRTILAPDDGSEKDLGTIPYDIQVKNPPEGWKDTYPLSGSLAPLALQPGEYFILGDNRALSNDSRSWGPISEERILGKAVFKYWPIGQSERL